jgi:adenosylmethionine-8-amino-7-oxononanoate aminotransferase
MDIAELLELDRQHVWHPYTSVTSPLPVYPVVSAKGTRLRLADGRELIDGMSSWWCAIHGYNHPALNAAMAAQLEKMSHVMFGGITHEPAALLCRELVRLAPPGLDKVFVCDSGSVAVEVAIKMAVQYWHAMGRPRKKRFLAVRSGYHGDTLGAMSVCDPGTGMHTLFSGILPEQLFAPAPKAGFDAPFEEADTAPLAALMREHRDTLAALILEPVVQGAGGMRFYSPAWLSRARELARENGLLFIADEIATGFGRTGKMFACGHADVRPDILCLGKALTGGTMTLAAALATREVAEGICQGAPGVFMHGPTFMGNPLACAAALASIRLLEESPWEKRIHTMETRMREGLTPCAKLPWVADVRVLGGIGVVETRSPVNVAEIQRKFVERGVWVRPFGKLVYIMPPYIIEADDLDHLCAAMRGVVEELEQ